MNGRLLRASEMDRGKCFIPFDTFATVEEDGKNASKPVAKNT